MAAAVAFADEQVAPALAMLGARTVNDPTICVVQTTASRPHVITQVDDTWCRTWQLQPAEVIGKTLQVIAGPRSGNARVGQIIKDRIKEDVGGLSFSWTDCGTTMNYTARTAEAVEHQLVLGPVLDARGQLTGILGVSRVLGAVAQNSMMPMRLPAQAPAKSPILGPEPMVRQLLSRPSVLDALRSSSHAVPAQRPPLAHTPGVRPSLQVRPAQPRVHAVQPVPKTPAPDAHSCRLKRRYPGSDDCESIPGACCSHAASGWSFDPMSLMGDHAEPAPAPEDLGFKALIAAHDVRLALNAATQLADPAMAPAADAARKQTFFFPRLGLPPNAPRMGWRVYDDFAVTVAR